MKAARGSGFLFLGAALAALPAPLAIPTPVLAQGRVQAVAYDTALYRGMRYRSIGPSRGGRSTAVAGIADEPFTFLFGGTGGGVWKTTDAGQSWTNISDEYFEAGSVGSIDVADSDPNVIYVGMGSADTRGNVSQGNGVYKSTDGGETWTHVGLDDAGQIGRIAVHPKNPDVAFAAALGHIFGRNAERGIFRTTDGGETWEKVLFVSDSTGAIDVSINPKNPRIVYAGMWRAERKPWTMISGAKEGGIWKSTDGGDTWKRLAGGLPEGLVGKTSVTVSPARPDRVWALLEAPNGKGGVYRSDDGGKTWRQVNKERKLQQRAWYYTHIYADARDENTVYALNTSYYKSIDGGRTFQSIRVPHGDVHGLWVNPTNPDLQVVANDGGAQVTLNGGRSWTTYFNQPTSEIYRVFVDEQFPYRVYGSQQDNSTIMVPSRPMPGVTPFQHWRSVGGCESGHIAIDPRNPDITYAGCYGGSINRVDAKTGDVRQILLYPQLQLGQAPKTLKYRFQWNAPIRLSPHDPDVVYHTSNRVHRTRDGGHSWETISPDLTRNDTTKQNFAGAPITRDNTGVEVYGTIFAFEESPSEPGVLWAGSDDGLVHISRDDGATWTEITPPELPEFSTVNTIELSAHAPGRAFLAAYRYRQDDFTPYMFRTDDYGQTWTRLSNQGVPANHFVRVLREDPERRGLLYAGTEYGMYVSFDDGRSWGSLQLNLPVTPITDLRVHHGDLVVATQGRSFWILDDLSPLRQLGEEIAASDVHLFEPREAFRSGGGRFGGGGGGGSGATIYYYLANAPEGNVTLEVLDGAGQVVRTYASRPSKFEKREGDPEGFKPDSIPAEAGLNRMRWNLAYEDPVLLKDAVIWGFTGGPRAVPGTYRVRLTSGDEVRTQELSVRLDPRLSVSREALQEQFDLMVRVREMLVRDHDAVREIRSVRKQVKEQAKLAEDAGFGEGLAALADSIGQKLGGVEKRLMQTKNESRQDPLNFPPMLDNQIAYLYGYILGTTDRPNVGATERMTDLEEELSGLLEELQGVLDEDVARFNRTLEERGVPPVVVKKRKLATD
ncbi:MAG: WD40/YVTN/BNR-like repeat-containing protein [Gemmatimonadota bacterium]